MFTPEISNLTGKIIKSNKYIRTRKGRKTKQDWQASYPNPKSLEVLELITDAFFAVDKQWRITAVNHQAEQILHQNRQDLLGKNLWKNFPQPLASEFESEYRSALAQNKPKGFETYYAPLDLWFEARIIPNKQGLVIQFLDITKYKKTEAKLLQQQTSDRAFLQVISDLMFRIDREGTYLDAIVSNPEDLLFPANELIGKQVETILPPELAQQTLFYIQQALVTGQIQTFEHQLLIQGEIRLQEARIIKTSEHEVIEIIQDITERKQSEQTLAQQAQIIEQIPNAVISTNLEGYITHWNRAAEKMYGYTASEAIGQPLTFIHPEGERKFLQQHIVELVLEKQPQELETRAICKNQTEIWTHLSLSLLRNERGNAIGLVVSTHDITEQRQAKDNLRQSEQFLRSIYDGVETSIFVVDVLENGEFRYVGMNPAHEQLTGIASEQIEHKIPQQLFAAETAEAVCQHYLECIQAGKPITYEECFHFKGSAAWLETTLTPLRTPEGKIYRIVGTSIDITERKLAEEVSRESEERLRDQATQLEETLHQLQATQSQLVQHEKMSSLGQLVAGVAHEINNPVNFIYGNLRYANEYARDLLHLIELYQQHYPDPKPEIQQVTDRIDLDFIISDFPTLFDSMKVGAERIRQIVLSLRNFSRHDEDGLKAVNLHEGIDSTLLILQHRLKEKGSGVQVIKEYNALPTVECYPGQLNQVFMNLIANAIDALEESKLQTSPTIWISTKVLTRQSKVAIAIRDNGSGISSKALSHLFDPFFTTKPVGKGTGLGLSICYQIVVNNHHGQLRCNSEPGKGAEFIIEIPIFRRH